jgi:hypothetical protein
VDFLSLHEKVIFLIVNTVGMVLPLQAEFFFSGHSQSLRSKLIY